MWYASPHQSLFINVFDEYNFSTTLNLFDSKNSYTYGKHKSKCATKMHHCIIFVKGSKLGVKNLDGIFLENCTKSTKMAIYAA